MKVLKPNTFLSVINDYYNYYFTVNDLSPITKGNYTSYYKGIESFLIKEEKFNVLIEEVERTLMYKMYIFIAGKTSKTNAARTVDLCKRISEWACEVGLLDFDKIAHVKVKRDKIKDVVYLEENELSELMKIELTEAKELLAKHYYIIQALQGLSYGDLRTFKIIKDNSGEWIYNHRCKGANEYWVPVHPMTKEILAKYNYRLPFITNREYNSLIRKITGGLDINKHLTSHTGRKTFATRMYNEGWSIESIADMMGHSSTETTRKYYIKKSRKRLEMEVKQRQIA